MDTIGNRLKAARTGQGLSQEDLAALSGVSALTIIRIEQGKSKPRLDTVRKLASSLSILEQTLAYGAEGEKQDHPGMEYYSSFEFAEKMEAEARKLVEKLGYLESLDSLPAKERAKIRREIPKSEKVLRMWEDLKARHPKRI